MFTLVISQMCPVTCNACPDHLLSLQEVQLVQHLQALPWHLSFLLPLEGQGDLEDQ